MVLTVQVLVIGLCFTGPVFNTQMGIVFWLLSASVFGAQRTRFPVRAAGARRRDADGESATRTLKILIEAHLAATSAARRAGAVRRDGHRRGRRTLCVRARTAHGRPRPHTPRLIRIARRADPRRQPRRAGDGRCVARARPADQSFHARDRAGDSESRRRALPPAPHSDEQRGRRDMPHDRPARVCDRSRRRRMGRLGVCVDRSLVSRASSHQRIQPPHIAVTTTSRGRA